MLASLVFAAPAPALQFQPPFRISHTGADGDTTRVPLRPAVAWGAAGGGRYLVTFEADGLATNDDIEVFARLLDGNGTALTGDVRLSVTGTEDTTPQQSWFSDVVFNPVSGDFFVVWDAEVTTTRREIMLARVPSSGAAPTSQVQISDDNGATGTTPAIDVDPATGGMLVTWSDQRAPHVGLNDEAYVQRLDANGAEVGGDVRISQRNTDVGFDGRVFYPDVAWNAALGRWLVVWQYNGSDGYGAFQQLDANAAEVGPDDAQFSATGGEPALAPAGAGGWHVAASTAGSIVTRRIDAAGTAGPDGPALPGGTAALSAATSGGFLVTSVGAGVPALELAADGGAAGPATTAGLPGTPTTGSAFDALAGRWLVVGTGPIAPAAELEVHGAFTGPATPAPPAGPAPSAPGPAPATAPATPKPKPIALTSVATLPSARKCVSRRNFRIRLREPSGVEIAEARVFVNGKRVKVVKGVRKTANVDLRGLPKGRFTVKIELRTADGRTVRGTRKYRTCAPKRR